MEVQLRKTESRLQAARASAYRERLAAEANKAARLGTEIEALRERERSLDEDVRDRIRALVAQQKEIERRQNAVGKILRQPAQAEELDLPGESGAALLLPWLDKLSERLAGIEAHQRIALHHIASRAARKAERFRAVLAEVGLAPAGRELPPHVSAFAAMPVNGDDPAPRPAESFKVGLARAVEARERLSDLRSRALRLPVRSPLEKFTVTSDFGNRRHPILGRRDFHDGVDLRAARGEPVRAAGPGKVTAVVDAGSYGRLVVIEHGNDVTTRYAHLSSAEVKTGQQVEAGTIVGRAGNTGRSTGPHLHYETRVEGKPIDPARFLDAGATLEKLSR